MSDLSSRVAVLEERDRVRREAEQQAASPRTVTARVQPRLESHDARAKEQDLRRRGVERQKRLTDNLDRLVVTCDAFRHSVGGTDQLLHDGDEGVVDGERRLVAEVVECLQDTSRLIDRLAQLLVQVVHGADATTDTEDEA